MDTIDIDKSSSYFILAGIHYLSGLVPIGITHILIATALGKAVTLFLIGMAVSICYNMFATLEEVLSEMAWKAEQTVLDEWQ